MAEHPPPGFDIGAVMDAAIEEAPAPSSPPLVEPEGGLDIGAVYDRVEAVDREDLEQRERLLNWRIANPAMDPDAAGEVLRMTAVLNASGADVDPSFVAEHLPRLKFRAVDRPFDLGRLAREHPALADFLSRPTGAAGADDVGNLETLARAAQGTELVASRSLVEALHRRVSSVLQVDNEWLRSEDAAGLGWLLRAPRDVLGDKAREQEMIFAGYRAMRGWSGPGEEAYAKALFRKLQRTYGADGWLEKAWAGLFDWGSELAVDLGVRAVGAVAGGKVGAAVGGAGGTAAAPGAGTAAGGAGGAAVGAAVGQFTTDFVWSYYQTAGSLYTQVLVEAEEQGLEVDRAKVAQAVDAGSLAIAGALAFSFGKVLKRVPGVRELYGRMMKRAVREALEASTVRRAGVRALTQLAGNYATVGGIMGLQAAGQRATTELALESAADNYQANLGRIPDAFVAGAVDAMVSFGFLGLAGPVVDLRGDVRRLGEVQEKAQRVEAAVAAARGSKLAERAPEAFQELYRSFQPEGPELDQVFFSLEDFDGHWKGRGLDPREVAGELLGDGGRAYDEARATGSDLGVPMETYVTRLARSEPATELVDRARLEDGGRSISEERAWREAMPERIRELADVEPDVMEAGRRAVYDRWHDQAVRAGVREDVADANARLVSAVFDQFAARFNEDSERRGEARERTALEVFEELADVAILGPGQERAAPAAPSEAAAAAQPAAEGELQVTEADILETEALEQPGAPRAPLSSTLEAEDRAGVVVGAKPGEFAGSELGAPFSPREGATPDPVALGPSTRQILEAPGFAELVNEAFGADGVKVHPIRGSWLGKPEPSFVLQGLTQEQAASVARMLGFAFSQEAVVEVAPNPEQAEGIPGVLLGREDVLAPEDVERIGARLNDVGIDYSTTVDGRALKVLYFGEEEGRRAWAVQLVEVAQSEGLETSFIRVRSELHGAEDYTAQPGRGGEGVRPAWHQAGAEGSPGLFGRVVDHLVVPYIRAAEAAGYAFDAGRFAERFGLDDDQRALIESRLAEGEPQRLAQPPAPERVDPTEGVELPSLGAGVLRFRQEDAVDVLHQPAFHGTAAQQIAQVSLAKVGTGTGLAAEGWGFYASSLEDIAELYREEAERRAGQAGQVLRLDIPEDTELLDSRAPVAAQRPTHLEALRRAGLLETRDGVPWVVAGLEERPALEVTAKELYRAVGDMWLMGVGPLAGVEASRPDEAASKYFASIGIKGMHYPAELTPAGQAGRNFVIWDEAGIQILDTLRQDEREGAGSRGEIVFTAKEGVEARKFNIRLLEGADESTLAHETGHFLIEVMRDLSGLEEAPEAIRADYDTLVRWMGYESPEDRHAALVERRNLAARRGGLSEDETRRLREIEAREERLSHGWEGYLAEGTPPAPELAGVFARFRGWMLRLYRGLVGIERHFKEVFGEDLGLNDTARGVFDRLLGASVEVERARRTAELGVFQPAVERMTPEAREEYARIDGEARAEAEAELVRRIAESQRRENKAWWREEQARVREEVEAELANEPTYRAIAALQSGIVHGREGSTKLDRRQLEASMGTQAVRALPRGVTSPRGGVDADTVAPLLGFDDGNALLAAMLEAEPRRKRVDRETQDRLEAMYGKALLEEPEQLAEAALSAVHTDKAALKVLLELRALSGELGGEARRTSVADLGVLQDNVQRLLMTKELRQISPGRYLRSERAAANRALGAAVRGDLRGAYAEKEGQLLNMLLYRGAKEIREAADKAERKLKRMKSERRRARLGKASPLYRDAVDGILAAVGLGPAPASTVTPEQLLAQLERDAVGVERVEDAVTGETRLEAQFDAALLAEVLRAPRRFSALTPAHVDALVGAVSVMDAAARAKAELRLGERRVSREAWLAEAEAAAARNLPRVKPRELSGSTEEASALFRAGRLLENVDGLLLEMRTMVAMLDGGDLDGPWHQAILEPYDRARMKEGELTQTYLKALTAQWEKLPPELQRRAGESIDLTERLPVPEALTARANRHVRPRADLWMLALNLGNDGNRQRLLDGYGWTEAQVMGVLNTELTAAEWQWVQAVWDSLESLYPEVARVHEEDTGLALGKVEATPVETPHGTLRGGYFPAVYDRRLSGRGVAQEEDPASVAGLLGGSYTRPATAQSHTRGRAAQVKDYLLLDWSVVPSHVAQVVHDVAFRGYLKQTAALFLDRRFQALLSERLGEQRMKQWIPWLQAVAGGLADAVPANQKVTYRFIRGLRNNSAISILGYSLPVAMGDLTNPLMAAAGGLVKVRHLAPALAKASNPFAWRKMRAFVLEHSPEVAHRTRLDETSLVDHFELFAGKPIQLGRAKRFQKAIQHSAFALMRATDALTTTPTWWAAYQQAMHEQRTALAEGKLEQGEAHAVAVREADTVIRRLFPSHEPGERAAILNDRGFLGSLLMFHSYMNKMYNLQRLTANEAITAWQDPGSPAMSRIGITARATGLLLAQWLVFGAMGEFLSGRGPEEGEEEWEWLLRKTLVAPFSTVPFIGQGAEQAIGSALTGKRPRPSLRAAPGLSVIDAMIRSWDRLQRSDDPDKALFELLELVGIVLGLPTRQPRRTGEFLAGGDADPTKPLEFIGGVIYGERPRQPTNPATALSEAVGE